MNDKSILITGSGIISSIGTNKEEVLSSLLKQETGIGLLKYLVTEHKEFPVGEVQLTNEEMAERLRLPADALKTRTFLMGALALKEALKEATLVLDDLGKIGFISGTTVGGMDQSELYYQDFLTNNSKNQYLATHDCGACSEMIADCFGNFAFVTTLSTACSSAANALILGANMIKTGEADIVVCGGSECITKFHLNGFNSLMILDTEPCRPFDETRAGLNLGEGAAYVVLESEESAKRRKVKPVAILSGYGNACDAYHQTASSPDGKGVYLAMEQALERANLKKEQIDYINAHGTGTPNNDLSESIAMKRLFEDNVPPVSSTKSFTGHTTSASGSIEVVICLLAMQNQFFPANLNWKNQMEEGITPVSGDIKAKMPIKHVLCNSFGFGGNDSSLVLTNPNI